MTTQHTLWVIMANDYPAGVATTEADRDRMLAMVAAFWRKRWEQEHGREPWAQGMPHHQRTNVYVRAYAFEPNITEPGT